MAAKYLLDSTVLIDHLNGVSKATEWIDKLEPEDAVISVITRAEVLTKAGDGWESATAILDQYDCLTIGPDEADLAAGLRNRYRLKLPDAFQVALAQSEELILITRDVDDFKKPIEGLEVKIPYRIY